jgi:hypothetical protein
MLDSPYAGSRCCHGRRMEVCSAAVDGRQSYDRGGKALVLERVAVGGLVALAPGRVIRAIAPPESDTEPASAWKEISAKFVSDISYGAVVVGRSGIRFVAGLRAPSQHVGSVHKDSPCRIPQELTPLLTPPRAQHAAIASKESHPDKPILQPQATRRNRCRRIVAPKVAGSSPVGHPLFCR